MSRPTAILLDLDDTLYDYEAAHSAGFVAAIDHLESTVKVPSESLTRLFLQSRQEVRLELNGTASSHSKILQFKRTLETLGIPQRIDIALELESVYWGRFLRSMELSEGSHEFLDLTRELAVPVFITTDMTLQIQIRKLLFLGVAKYITALLTSEETGSDKPSLQFFHHLGTRLGCDLSEVWIIGDDVDKDGEFAELAGGRFFRVPTVKHRGRFFRQLTRRLANQ